jgi:hypothetical protein
MDGFADLVALYVEGRHMFTHMAHRAFLKVQGRMHSTPVSSSPSSVAAAAAAAAVAAKLLLSEPGRSQQSVTAYDDVGVVALIFAIHLAKKTVSERVRVLVCACVRA